MSPRSVPAIIYQTTLPTGNDEGSWASLFLTYASPSPMAGGGGSRYQTGSIPLFDGPMKPYEEVIMGDTDLRPSLWRPQQIVVEIANWLSLLGSIAIILHIPKVMKQAPAQRKRMLIILFTAISNTGFALANVVTDLTSATTYIPCSISAWCYVFFQILTCLLVIVSSFRLCGVFLFQQQRAFPTKAVVLCPLIAFTLATSPAAAGQFQFDTCGHYCWFKLEENVDCTVRSPWAWFCFYIWMIVFLIILFGSTSFVMIKIAFTVMSSRSALNKVVNAGRDESLTVTDPTASPQPQSVSTFERLRTLSQAFTLRTASIFSHLSSKLEATSHATTQEIHNSSNSQSNGDNDGIPVSDIRIELTQPEPEVPLPTPTPSTAFINRMASLGLDSPTLRSEGILASPIDSESAARFAMPDQTQPLEATRSRSPVPLLSLNGNGNGDSSSPAAVLRAKERPFIVAILRQALYPISISVSGCLQTIVDLTLGSASGNTNDLDYAANIGTSIQGFLFFLVFLFDPAVVQTRETFRKYLIWKYYVEFYYSLGMPQEGRVFEDAFLQRCRETLNEPQHVNKFDQLTRPPPYSWSVQHDVLAMPSDFQTAYPLAGARTRGSSGRTLTSTVGRGESSTVGQLSMPYGSDRSGSPSKLRDPPTTIVEDDETPSTATTSLDMGHSEIHRPQAQHSSDFMSRPPITETNARPTDYTHLQSIPHPLSNEAVPSPSPSASVVSFSDPWVHPMSMMITVPPVVTLAKPEGEDPDPDTDTRRTPGSPEPSSPLTLSPTGRATWPRSNAPRLRTSVSFNSTDSDDISDEFGTSENTVHGRRYPLKAPYAGDILSFHNLDRVTTIGGSDLRSPHRIYKPSMVSSSGRKKTMATMRNDSKSSSGTMFQFTGPLRFLSMGPRNKNQNNEAGGEQDPEYAVQQPVRSMSDQYRYQCHFQFPRLAYMVHRAVRIIYIPRVARLPPIPNPFSSVGRYPHCDVTASRTPSVPQLQDGEDLWQDTDLGVATTTSGQGGRAA